MFTDLEYLQGLHIHVIDTLYIRPRMAACHVIVEKGEAALIDVGTSVSSDLILKDLARLSLDPEDVRYLIVTHIHLDHAGGAGALMQSCPNATLLVHPKGAKHLIDPEKLIEASIDIYGEETFTRLYGNIPSIPSARVMSVHDGFSLDFNGRALYFFDTPGHARHHCSIWDPQSRGVFSGDTLGMALPELQKSGNPPFIIPTTSPAAFEPDALQASIHRLVDLEPERFFLTHYGPVQAHPEAVERLLALIRSHAELAETCDLSNLQNLEKKLADLFYQSYCDYRCEKVDREPFLSLLAGDIRLNAQGVAIYGKRQRNNH